MFSFSNVIEIFIMSAKLATPGPLVVTVFCKNVMASYIRHLTMTLVMNMKIKSHKLIYNAKK